MAKLIYSMMVSLDGFIESSIGSIDWIRVDDELHRFANDEARETGTFLYGRRLYEVMSAYWPTADTVPATPDYMVDFARIWKAKPKIVFSTTLERVEGNSRLLRGRLAETVTALKAAERSDLSVGGATLAAECIRLGLVDEFRLLVQPVVLGAGKPYLPPLDRPIDLRLVETRTFRSGVTYLRYDRPGDAGR